MRSSESPARHFADRWRLAFGDVPPLGFHLRPTFPDRWVRFHALPGSVRYARSTTERREMLHRANLLATALFEAGTPVWLVVPQGSPSEAMWIAAHGAQEALTWRDLDEDASEAWEWVFYAAAVHWQPGVFDELFQGIAEDQGRAVFTDAEVSRVLAPYDGGFDVIWSPAEVSRLRRRFASWLSPREDGL